MTDATWTSLGPRSFIDRRMALKRTGLVRYNVRAYHGVIVRRTDRGQEYDYCGHAHNKASAARKCGEREARRRNREEAKKADAFTLRKVTEQHYGRGLASTTERSYWEAVKPDGTRICTGPTKRQAAANAREVLELATRFREQR